jgi:hypothetical protein
MNQPAVVTRMMPTPDQTAYATPSGIVRNVERQEIKSEAVAHGDERARAQAGKAGADLQRRGSDGFRKNGDRQVDPLFIETPLLPDYEQRCRPMPTVRRLPGAEQCALVS